MFLALAAIALAIPTLFEAIRVSYFFYQDHYTIPLEKYGVLTPMRWQDIVFIAGFWAVALAILLLAYALLRTAFRSGPSRVIS